MADFGQKLIAKFANDNAKFLFLSAATGWFLASAAQTMGIITNKKIDKEDKKFLIPQEICDGAANIGLYALITAPLMKVTEKLIDNGTVVLKNIKKGTPEFDKLKGGARVLASIAGAIISSNILTPIVRNKLGSIAQRKAVKQKVQIAEPNYDPYYQPLFQKNYEKSPYKMSNYVTFARNNGMKI